MTVQADADLLGRYLTGDGPTNDESVAPDGSIRPHWSRMLDGYRNLGDGELVRRADEIALLLEQEGVTYNRVTDDTEAPARPRPWNLDPVPLLITGEDWTGLERGLAQRAELFDAILADLYGPRRLLRDHIIPPAMILNDPQYLRAWHGIEPAGHRHLPILATDLHRDRSGSWRVLSHRAQAPSGMAYAIQNRRALARVFPALFRSSQVRRIGPFVQVLRSAIEQAAPDGVDSPTVVVLSPGSLSETAYEHGAIATQLGYPLVEGSDLRIRDGRVWLKTISDLVPVDVILRRVDAMFCDPLELRPDSTLGVPGLVDACRTGAVSVLNPLGAGVLENAGLLAILPRLSRALLGADLHLPGVEAWWCGDEAGRSHVLANLGSLVVRPLSRASLTHSFDTSRASRAELDQLRSAITDDPVNWVGQARAEPATSP
ncbi:MAG: circularly permuted type 2 ATP-grasp protein, partial [Actinomycetota bacterium]